MKTENHKSASNLVLISQDGLELIISKCVRAELLKFNYGDKKVDDCILFIKDVASLLGVSKETIYGYTCKKTIPYEKRGRKLYFRKSEIDNWLKESRRKTVAETEKEAFDFMNKRKGYR